MVAEIINSRMLVPLDGSGLAERALPAAERVAHATNSGLVLVRVVPLTAWAFAEGDAIISGEIYQPILESEEREAIAYLDRVADGLRARGLTVQIQLARGEAAEALLDLESRLHIGIVVMTTHGRTGIPRLALGSVADRLARDGKAPVLIVRPFQDEGRAQAFERALVPLDGSSRAEAALDAALPLAGRLVRQITLARSVDPTAGADAVAEARRYLEEQRLRAAERIADASCAIEYAVLQGDPASQLIAHARREEELVILATRGHTGVKRLALGSVADRMLHQADVPLLLVHP